MLRHARPLYRAALLLAALILVLPALSAAESPDRELDALMKKYDVLGASVAVFRDGEIFYTYCSGKTSPGGDPVTPETGFLTGSISKMVSNMALMKLLEEKDIPLDTELGTVLGYPVRNPAFPEEPVTLRQLMTHTASLRDDKVYRGAINGNERPLSGLLGRLSSFAFSPDAAPGRVESYSNFGGGIIGSLLETLAEEPLDKVLAKEIFGPLGITAGFDAARLPADMPLSDVYHRPGKTVGRILRDGTPIRRFADPDSAYLYTAGKLIITAPDLCKLCIALCDGGVYGNTRILREETVREMLTPQCCRGSVACDVEDGLLVLRKNFDGHEMWGHGGMAYGMICGAWFDPDTRFGAVILTGGAIQDKNGRTLVTEAMDLFLSLWGDRVPADPFEVNVE